MSYQIDPALLVEELGDELLVCDPTHLLVHRLRGDSAVLVRQVHSASQPVALTSGPEVEALLTAGILLRADADPSAASALHTAGSAGAGASGARVMSRRFVVHGAAAMGAVGLVTAALPGAAAASSIPTGTVVAEGDNVSGPVDTLPQYPSERPTFLFDDNAGTVSVLWRSDPQEFWYDYTWVKQTLILNEDTQTLEPDGEPQTVSGMYLSKATYQVITSVREENRPTRVTLTVTSISSPSRSRTGTFTFEAD